jgi:holo-[acyl-carrier protein] synthase
MDMIKGVGVDAVPVERMRLALDRSPNLATRVFTPQELATADSRASRDQSLAARFAAKEATRKALGKVIPWHDVEVTSDEDRRPALRVSGYDDLTFHVSLTHTDDTAVAVVVAEG